MMNRLRASTLLPFLSVLVILLPLYLATLQTIPNGSEQYYMIDVGETQNVLNLWGTLHATGYPLYVIIGNILVTLLKAIGISAAPAPAIASLFYGLIALALIYFLASRLTGNSILSAVVAILFGLTRTVWVHNSIAEVYTFGLLLLVLLLVIALWPQTIRGRVYWLALIGGIGVFHHRAIIMAAPALLYAVWPEIKEKVLSSKFLVQNRDTLLKVDKINRQKENGRDISRPYIYAGFFVGTRYIVSVLNHLPNHFVNHQHRVWKAVVYLIPLLLLGLIGFLPYAYLPIRAQAGAEWVYGTPGTWDGFWDQFLGHEADRFIGLPSSLDGIVTNLDTVNTVLVTDLTVPGILFGLFGLLLALRNPARRRTAITLLLSGGAAYLFHILLYTDILSALILPIDLSLAFGWLFLLEWIFSPQFLASDRQFMKPEIRSMERLARYSLPAVILLAFATTLIVRNLPFIRDLTSNPTGLETIALAKEAPPGSTLMLDWGPRHYAVGFARDVLGELPDITLVKHTYDFKNMSGELVTADFTFYNRPVSWWEQQLGKRIYVRAVAPHLVQIDTRPEMASIIDGAGIQVSAVHIDCTPDALNLYVDWLAVEQPQQDLSVFVHVLDSGGAMIAQGDEAAPVYGWRPLTTWDAGEIVRDVYPLPRLPDAASIAYGMYYQDASGAFINAYSFDLPVKCDEQ